LNPASTQALVTVGAATATLSSSFDPITLSVTDAAVTTTAMISPLPAQQVVDLTATGDARCRSPSGSHHRVTPTTCSQRSG